MQRTIVLQAALFGFHVFLFGEGTISLQSLDRQTQNVRLSLPRARPLGDARPGEELA